LAWFPAGSSRRCKRLRTVVTCQHARCTYWWPLRSAYVASMQIFLPELAAIPRVHDNGSYAQLSCATHCSLLAPCCHINSTRLQQLRTTVLCNSLQLIAPHWLLHKPHLKAASVPGGMAPPLPISGGLQALSRPATSS
jgi:hypothetical protein